MRTRVQKHHGSLPDSDGESVRPRAKNLTITFANNGIPNTLLGVAHQAHESSIEVARRNAIVYNVGVVLTEYRAHQACMTKCSIYKVGGAYIDTLSHCTC